MWKSVWTIQFGRGRSMQIDCGWTVSVKCRLHEKERWQMRRDAEISVLQHEKNQQQSIKSIISSQLTAIKYKITMYKFQWAIWVTIYERKVTSQRVNQPRMKVHFHERLIKTDFRIFIGQFSQSTPHFRTRRHIGKERLFHLCFAQNRLKLAISQLLLKNSKKRNFFFLLVRQCIRNLCSSAQCSDVELWACAAVFDIYVAS